jgi:hypothetical protein
MIVLTIGIKIREDLMSGTIADLDDEALSRA